MTGATTRAEPEARPGVLDGRPRPGKRGAMSEHQIDSNAGMTAPAVMSTPGAEWGHGRHQ